MKTPPILSIPDTTEPPSGQHGPGSGLRHHEDRPEPAEPATEPLALTTTETVAEPAIDVTPLAQIPCSHPGCPKTLPVWTRHAENFAGWLCLEHKAGDAA